MNIYTYLQILSLTERELLSQEVGVSKTYLNFLASKKEGMSLPLASKIYSSMFNQSRDPSEQLPESAYLRFKKHKRKQKMERAKR